MTPSPAPGRFGARFLDPEAAISLRGGVVIHLFAEDDYVYCTIHDQVESPMPPFPPGATIPRLRQTVPTLRVIS